MHIPQVPPAIHYPSALQRATWQHSTGYRNQSILVASTPSGSPQVMLVGWLSCFVIAVYRQVGKYNNSVGPSGGSWKPGNVHRNHNHAQEFLLPSAYRCTVNTRVGLFGITDKGCGAFTIPTMQETLKRHKNFARQTSLFLWSVYGGRSSFAKEMHIAASMLLGVKESRWSLVFVVRRSSFVCVLARIVLP